MVYIDKLMVFVVLRFILSSSNCFGSNFTDFVQNGYVEETDPPIPFQFKFVEDVPEDAKMYPHGTKFNVICPFGMYFAYPWQSKSLICDDGEILQDDVSKYNHCIKYNQCSAANFDSDWIVKGYRLNSKINNLLNNGPLITDIITDSMTIEDTLKEYGKKSPSNIISKYKLSNTLSASTYPPILLLTCDILYTSFTVNINAYKPYAYCIKKSSSKKAKWSMGKKISKWKKLHKSCRKIIKTFKKTSPPPQGCTVLSEDRAECLSYKKFCAWDELQKFEPIFDKNKVDLRICTQQCLPWSCFSALTMPINCDKIQTESSCTKLIPAYAYWCEWDTEQQICRDKILEKQSEDYPIQIDICTTDNKKCRLSQSIEWWDQKNAIYNGQITALDKIKFGYQYLIFGIRHVVEPNSLLSKMRGSVVTSIRATQEMKDDDPTQITLDAAVQIEPNIIKTKFGILTRKKYSMLNKLFILDSINIAKQSVSKPYPEYQYISIELKSDELEIPSPPISFYLSTLTSTDCKRCILSKYPSSGMNAEFNTITNTLYTLQTDDDPISSMVTLQLPLLSKSNVQLKSEIKTKPGPERCGKNDLGCFIIFEPIMNDVASALVKFDCYLPVIARLNGNYDSSLLTVFGVESNKRSKVITKYTMKIAKTTEFVNYEGQIATLRWKVDIGFVKSIKIIANELPAWEYVVQQPIKIEFKSFDKLKTRPDKTKWILLSAKKTMPIDCNIQYKCNLCSIEVAPKSIQIRKRFSKLRLKVTPRIPGNFQVHFVVTGECADLVHDPPSLLVEVFRPDAGFVKVPEELTVMNGEWSEEFDISITRPPFRTELLIKPLTQEFQSNPLELRFDNVKRTMLQSASVSFSKLGIVNDQTIKIRPSLECGGGPPRELKWTLSGAIEEFYTPSSTFVNVLVADDDEDYCLYKNYELLMNNSNGTNMSFGFIDNSKQFIENEKPIVPVWRFEYYLIGGAITICILVILDQFKNQKFDKMIAIMSSGLQS